MPIKIKPLVYNETIRLMRNYDQLSNLELEFKRWLEFNYNIRVVNITLGFDILLDSSNYSDKYYVYIISGESISRSKMVRTKMMEHYREWLISFINLALKYHLNVDKEIEIRIFDIWEEICYDFQKVYRINFDADEYYRSKNPYLHLYKCFRLYKPVIMFNTHEELERYSVDGTCELIQSQYEEFLAKYDEFKIIDNEKVVFGCREDLVNLHNGDLNYYLELL